MKFLNLILHAGLIILINVYNDFVVYGTEPLNTCLDENNVIPQHYNIKLNINLDENTISDGTVEIRLDIQNAMKTICLHAISIQITRCEIIMVNTGHVQSTTNISEDVHSEIQKINFLHELKLGTYILTINYRFIMKDQKKHLKIYDVEKYIQLLVFNADVRSAHRIFPCWDDPLFKATFTITIEHPQQCKVFSNMQRDIMMKLNPRHALDQKWVRTLTHFEQTPVIPTYLVGIMIIDSALTSKMHGMITFSYNSQLTSNITFAQDVANHVTRIMKPYMKQAKNLSKIDIIVLPGEFEVIQKLGLLVYSQKNITYNETSDTILQKESVAAIVASGIIHQYIGIILSSSKTHLQLNEGLEMFFHHYVLTQIFKELPSDIYIIPFARARNSSADYPTDITLTSFALQNRVPFILRMLQHIMPQHIFERCISTYLKQYQFRSAEPNDLWNIFQQAFHKFTRNISWAHKYNLKDAINAFLVQRNYSELRVLTDYKTGYAHLYLIPTYENNGNNSNWTVPITYTLRNVLNFNDTMPCRLLKPFTADKIYVGTDSDNWIIVNLQRIGFYRLNYDSTNWKRLAHYLNHEEYTKIHVLNRAQIIDNAFHLMVKREIAFPLFLNIISYLKRETDFTVWHSMKPVVKYIWNICKNSELSKVKDIMSNIWDGLLGDVGYYNKDSDTNIIRIKRNFALQWACKFGHADCRRKAATYLKSHLNILNSKISYMRPWLKWVFCMGMMTANTTTLEDMMNKYKYIGKDILKYLAFCENEHIIIYYLDILLHAPKKFLIKNELRTQAYKIIVRKHAEKHNILHYFLNNFEALQLISKLSTKNTIIYIIKNVYAERNLYKIKEYLNDHGYLYRKILNDVEVFIHSKMAETEKDIRYFTMQDEII